MAVKQRKVTKALQSQVDTYIVAYEKMKELEKLTKQLRESIESEMDARGIFAIPGSDKGGIKIEFGERVSTSSQYTTYCTSLLRSIPLNLAKQCETLVVDKNEVEDLIKRGHLSKSLCEEHKIKNPSRTFKTSIK
jgi:hypothetical protein